MEASLNQQSSHGIMDELAAASSCSDASNGSSLSDFADDATSSSSWISPSSSDDRLGPLYEMSTLMAQLPFKRGLSKFFQGKSQSFTSLSNVRCLEDLAKPENPSKKKLKTCMSYGGDLNSHQRSNTQRASSFKPISKATRGSCSSLSAKRATLVSSKPPTPPQRVGCLANQHPLFA